MKPGLSAIRAGALALAVTAGVSLGGPAWAHHSFAMFDRDRTLDLVGVVKEFQWTNPHTWLQLDAPNAQGVVQEWSIEGNSTGTLSRMGWRPGSFKPGDKVTVKIYPMKDGSTGGSFVGAILANGQTLGRMEAAK
jgi:hypothetical protein